MSAPAVSIMQACAIAGVSRRTIYNWLKAGKLDYRRTAGGSVRILEASLWRAGNFNEAVRQRGFTEPLQPVNEEPQGLDGTDVEGEPEAPPVPAEARR